MTHKQINMILKRQGAKAARKSDFFRFSHSLAFLPSWRSISY